MDKASSPGRRIGRRRVSLRRSSTAQRRSAMEAVANANDAERLVADTVASAQSDQAMADSVLSSHLFAALSRDTRTKLLAALHPRHYSAGMFVCRQGMRGNTLFIITSGEVEVRWAPASTIPSGKSGASGDDDVNDENGDGGGGGGGDGNGGDVIARFRPGDFFGEAALFNADCLRTASIVVSSPSLHCMALRRQEISRTHIDREPFYNTLMQLAAERNILRKEDPGASSRGSHRFNPAKRGRRATRAAGRLSVSGLESIMESEFAEQEHERAAATVTEAAVKRKQSAKATQPLVSPAASSASHVPVSAPAPASQRTSASTASPAEAEAEALAASALAAQAQAQAKGKAPVSKGATLNSSMRTRRSSMQPSSLWNSAKRRTELAVGSVVAFKLPAMLQGSLYAKFRYRLRLKPQLVTRFSSVIRSISFTGGERDIEALAKTSRDILECSPARREDHQVAFIAEMCSRVPFRKRFCSNWTWSQWVALMRTARYEKLRAGQAIYRRGDRAQRIYIVLAGCIELQRLTDTEEQEATTKSTKDEEEDGSDEDGGSRALRQSGRTSAGLRSSRKFNRGSKRVSHGTAGQEPPAKHVQHKTESPADSIVSPRTQDPSVLLAQERSAVDAKEIDGPVSMDLGPGGHFGEAVLQRMLEGTRSETDNTVIKRLHDAVARGMTMESGEVRPTTAKGVVRIRPTHKGTMNRAAAMKSAQLAAQAAIANPTLEEKCLTEVLSFGIDDYSRISGSLQIEEMTRFLRSVPIFEDIAVLRLHRLANQAKVRVINRGTKLLSSGDEAPALYIVREGTLQCQLQPLRRRRARSGRSTRNSEQAIHESPLALCALGVGSVLGESGILNATSAAAPGPAMVSTSAPVASSSSSKAAKTLAAASISTSSGSSVGVAPSPVQDTANTVASAPHKEASVDAAKYLKGRQHTEYADVIASSSRVELIVIEPPYTRILDDWDVMARLKRSRSVQSKWLRKTRVPSAKKERVFHRMTATGRVPWTSQGNKFTDHDSGAVTANTDDVHTFLVRSQHDVLSEAGSLATPFSPVPTASERAATRLRVQAAHKLHNEQDSNNEQHDEHFQDHYQDQDQEQMQKRDQDQDQDRKEEQSLDQEQKQEQEHKHVQTKDEYTYKAEQEVQVQHTAQHLAMDSAQQMSWNARSSGRAMHSYLGHVWSRKTRMRSADDGQLQLLTSDVPTSSMDVNSAAHVPEANAAPARPKTADSILNPSFALRCGFAKAGMMTTVPGTRLPTRRVFDKFGGAHDERVGAPPMNVLVTKQRARRRDVVSFAQTPYIQYAQTRRTAAGHRSSPGRGIRPPQHAFYQVQSRIDHQRGELDAIAGQCNSAGKSLRDLRAKVADGGRRAEKERPVVGNALGTELHETYAMCNSSTVKKMFLGSIIEQAEAMTVEVAQTPEGRTALRL